MPEWISAVLSLISSGRIWYLHVESGVYKWSSESVVSLSWIVSACSRHQILSTLKLSLSSTCVLLKRVLTVLRPLASFSHWKSGKKAVGEVASACHMFTNSNRLIGFDRMAFNRQNEFRITQSSSSVASWVRLISKEITLPGWCSCALREEWWWWSLA